jgi:hypothetical protein
MMDKQQKVVCITLCPHKEWCAYVPTLRCGAAWPECLSSPAGAHACAIWLPHQAPAHPALLLHTHRATSCMRTVQGLSPVVGGAWCCLLGDSPG